MSSYYLIYWKNKKLLKNLIKMQSHRAQYQLIVHTCLVPYDFK